MFKKIITIILFCFIINNLYCQKNKFSLQIGYISNIIFNDLKYDDDNFLINKDLKGGVSFGMIIHKNIYNKSEKSIFGIESGITYTNVKYKTSLLLTTSENYFIETYFRNYNIPVEFIIKVKLKNNIIGQLGIGNTVSICPSDIYSEYNENNNFINNEFYEISYYTNRIQNNLTSSLGLNYKNKKHDVYLGIKILIPYKKTEFSEIYFNHNETGENKIIIDLYKNILNFELKYYLK